MSNAPLNTHVSRRSALKKAAAVGGILWVAPAIQSLNMTNAWASAGSWTTDLCYSVDIDIDPYGGVVVDTDGGFRCLSAKDAWSGPNPISVTSDGAGGWIVTVETPGARIVEGSAKGRDSQTDPRCTPGTLTGTNAMRFAETIAQNGKPIRVRDVELTFCIAAGRRQP